MHPAFRRSLLLLVALSTAASLQAQFYKLKGATATVGGTGEFTRVLTANPVSGQYTVATPAGGTIGTTVSNQQQFTTLSAGVLGSLAFHPRPWAGFEVNYGYTRYSERYTFNYSAATPNQALGVPTGFHEATGAYQFHPRHIPFQPFLNVGGGAIFFLPSGLAYQQRFTGLVETGFDIPTHNPNLAFRIQGRSLIYRAPNFYNAAISTKSWRATNEPGVSVVYRF